jgi:hypothetical protein
MMLARGLAMAAFLTQIYMSAIGQYDRGAPFGAAALTIVAMIALHSERRP